MTAREAILKRLRDRLGADLDGRRDVARQRIEAAPAGIIPQRGQLDIAGRVELFTRMAESVQASVERVASTAELPQAVASLLRSRNLPARIRIGQDARLTSLPWGTVEALERLSGAPESADLVGLSHAFAGIAETGTLVLHSGPDNPTTLNFLPELHVVVIEAHQIVADLEQVYAMLRQKFGKGGMPRGLNLVTGPSRSADIEQKLILGAHGPRALHILIVDSVQKN